MEKEYLKITPYMVAKRLGLNALIAYRSTGLVTHKIKEVRDDVWLYNPYPEHIEDPFLKATRILMEEGFLRACCIRKFVGKNN